MIENMAPVLTRLFTPLFAAVLVTFLGTLLWTGRGIDIERDVLIGVRPAPGGGPRPAALFRIRPRPAVAPGAFDVVQVVLVVSALLADAVALWAIAARITEFGFSPNRVAALGENVILLVNLAWSAVLYIRFLRGRGSFTAPRTVADGLPAGLRRVGGDSRDPLSAAVPIHLSATRRDSPPVPEQYTTSAEDRPHATTEFVGSFSPSPPRPHATGRPTHAAGATAASRCTWDRRRGPRSRTRPASRATRSTSWRRPSSAWGSAAETAIVPEGTLTAALLEGRFDGSPALWRDPEREAKLVYSKPYLENRLVLVARRGVDVSAPALPALAGKRIALVDGYAYGDALRVPRGPTYVAASTVEQSLGEGPGRRGRLRADGRARGPVPPHELPEEVKTRLAIGTQPLVVRTLHFALRRRRDRRRVHRRALRRRDPEDDRGPQLPSPAPAGLDGGGRGRRRPHGAGAGQRPGRQRSSGPPLRARHRERVPAEARSAEAVLPGRAGLRGLDQRPRPNYKVMDSLKTPQGSQIVPVFSFKWVITSRTPVHQARGDAGASPAGRSASSRAHHDGDELAPALLGGGGECRTPLGSGVTRLDAGGGRHVKSRLPGFTRWFGLVSPAVKECRSVNGNVEHALAYWRMSGYFISSMPRVARSRALISSTRSGVPSQLGRRAGRRTWSWRGRAAWHARSSSAKALRSRPAMSSAERGGGVGGGLDQPAAIARSVCTGKVCPSAWRRSAEPPIVLARAEMAAGFVEASRPCDTRSAAMRQVIIFAMEASAEQIGVPRSRPSWPGR